MKHLNLKQTIDSNNRYHVSMETISADLNYSFDKTDIFGLNNCISLEDGSTFKEKAANFFKKIIEKIKQLIAWFKEKIFGTNKTQTEQLNNNSKQFKENIEEAEREIKKEQKDTTKQSASNEQSNPDIQNVTIGELKTLVENKAKETGVQLNAFSDYHRVINGIFDIKTDSRFHNGFVNTGAQILNARNLPYFCYAQNDYTYIVRLSDSIVRLVTVIKGMTETYKKSESLQDVIDYLERNSNLIYENKKLTEFEIDEVELKDINNKTIKEVAYQIYDTVKVISPMIERVINLYEKFLIEEQSKDSVVEKMAVAITDALLTGITGKDLTSDETKLEREILKTYYELVRAAINAINKLTRTREQFNRVVSTM